MSMKINNPSSFFNTIQLRKSSQALSSSLAKLSSGLRINKAADDASGLTIADMMESQMRSIGQSIRNANDLVSMNQVADGALAGASDILKNMRVKAVQAANESQSLQSRQSLQADIKGSLSALSSIMQTTSFNGIKLFEGDPTNINLSTDVYSQDSSSSQSSLELLNNLTLAGHSTTTVDSVVSEGSVLKTGSTIQAGSSLGFNLTESHLDSDVTTTAESTLTAGSTLAEGSQIAAESVVGGNVNLGDDLTTSKQSELSSGSLLKSGSTLAAGTIINSGFTAKGTNYTAGDTLASDVVLDNDVTINAPLSLASGSTLKADSVTTTGSVIGGISTTKGSTLLSLNTTLESGSLIKNTAGTNIQSGSTIGSSVTLASDANVSRNMTLKAGSSLGDQSELASGSSLGGRFTSSNTVTLRQDMILAAGTSLAAGSEIAAGTVLTNDIMGENNQLFTDGETLKSDIITAGVNYLNQAQNLKANSVITAGSEFAAAPTTVAPSPLQEIPSSDQQTSSLNSIDVTTSDGAQAAIEAIDRALLGINELRSEFGSRQNQAESSINNLRNTLVNVAAAKSTVLDVDLAEEIMVFSQAKVLNEAQAFASAQTGNINKMNILDLLQG